MREVRTRVEYLGLLDALNHASGAVAIDTETTGLNTYVCDEIRGISVATQGDAWYLPISHPDSTNFDPADLIEALRRRRRFVFHHAVFDWPVLCQVHDDLEWWMEHTVWDTQVVNWMLDENLKTGLKESCERILGHDAGEEKRALKAIKGKTWGTYSAEDIGKYAAMDARLTYDLGAWQIGFLSARYGQPGCPSKTAIQREFEVQRCLARMIRTGIRVDPEMISEGEAGMLQRLESLGLWFAARDVNPNSPRQVGRWLYDDLGYPCPLRTKTGARSTAVAALESLAEHECPEAVALLENRKLTKAVTAYFRPLRSLIGQDGRVHPHFSSTRTVTGRFSCSNPNLQTIPGGEKMPEVRRCFVPADGFELWEYDLSQAELRVIAGYAGETSMIEALEEGRDLHLETAAAIFGESRAAQMRKVAKNINFSFAYGVGPRKLAYYLAAVPTECDYWSKPKAHRPCRACQVCEAASILDRYRKTYPKLAKLLDGMGEVAKANGVVPAYKEGRWRHFKGPGYRVKDYTAVNFIVQGGIGEFMKDVLIEWYAKREDPDHARACLQVHDSLWVECSPGLGPLVRGELQGIADGLQPFPMRMIFEEKRIA